MRLSHFISACLVFAVAHNIAANYGFTVSDIRVQGLMRVPAGTVFNRIPLEVGAEADSHAVRDLIRKLYKTGYFDDIQVERDGDVLLIRVTERPAIDEITIEGNKAIPEEELRKGLASIGLEEGEIFKQVTLERIQIDLERQYTAQGKYNASIGTEVKNLPRNRVSIAINIEEGKRSGIQQIQIVGNTFYDQNILLSEMELKHPTYTGILRGQHKYSREKLSGDLESLEAFYRNRGHVEFAIMSTQVSMTPDRRHVYITININEGDRYTINKVDLIGDLGEVRPQLLEALFLVQKGQIFSNSLVAATEERLNAALGNAGYTFSTASGIPQVNDGGTVDIKFIVNTGKRVYVRRLTFTGNVVSQDGVLRREMRQFEGSWASASLIDLSKQRLGRLGYFEGVNVETPLVPGTEDQIDVNFSVTEQPTGSIGGAIGYQKHTGILFQGNFEQRNLAGSGNSLGIELNWSDYQKSASYSFFDPYFTEEGVSRGINFFYSDTNYNARNLAQYSTSSLGGGITFGFPIGETRTLQFAGRFSSTDITSGLLQSAEIQDLVTAEGAKFLNYTVETLWRSSTLDRFLFPTRGRKRSVAVELTVPGSDLNFYKVVYQGDVYLPMKRRGYGFRFRTELGYGEAYGDTERFPFYEHFYAGGLNSVRGYERWSLGPRSTPASLDPETPDPETPDPETPDPETPDPETPDPETPDPEMPDPEMPENPSFNDRGHAFGGNALLELSTEFYFPMPFVENLGQVRSVFFIDAGNVFNTSCSKRTTNCVGVDLNELRYSAGLAVSWNSQLGPMTVSISVPFNDGPFDATEEFAFEFGSAL